MAEVTTKAVKKATKPKAGVKAKRKPIVQQPAPVAGTAAGLTSLVPFLPANWQSYGYALAAVIGLASPVLAAMQQNRQREND